MQYIILKHWKSLDLEVEVNTLLKKGWTLQGGVTVAYDTNDGMILFVQVMTKQN